MREIVLTIFSMELCSAKLVGFSCSRGQSVAKQGLLYFPTTSC
jgi:hypothetical protein